MLLTNFIESDRLTLKNLTLEDAEGNYYQWLRDPNVNQFLEIRHHLPNLKDLQTFIDKMNHSDNNLLLGIYLTDGSHIGNIKLGPIHLIYERATMGLLIGDKTQWGKGYATEAINLLTEYAFNHLTLSSVWAGCYSTNIASYKAFLKASYQENSRQQRYWKIDGKFIDNILLVRFNNA